tara:strand:+ start:7 stop:645 length:639 start_codon:yes stop_codon:yes gene_type:complete
MNGIIKIHNKEYKTVALRVTEFIASPQHEGWAIETQLITAQSSDGVARSDEYIVMKATIRDEKDRSRGTGYAEEKRGSTNINKTSAVENCETSAIGRALSAIGFGGTEYASANEVTDAIIQQTAMNASGELLNYNAAVREHIASISAIKDALADEDLETAAEEWGQLNEQEQRSIWKAPSKGGIFTTQELATIKTSEFREAGITADQSTKEQ